MVNQYQMWIDLIQSAAILSIAIGVILNGRRRR